LLFELDEFALSRFDVLKFSLFENNTNKTS